MVVVAVAAGFASLNFRASINSLFLFLNASDSFRCSAISLTMLLICTSRALTPGKSVKSDTPVANVESAVCYIFFPAVFETVSANKVIFVPMAAAEIGAPNAASGPPTYISASLSLLRSLEYVAIEEFLYNDANEFLHFLE